MIILLFLPCPNIIFGCTNPLASNYNSEATDDDSSCIILGCTDVETDNYSVFG